MGQHFSANHLADHLIHMVEDESYAQDRKSQRAHIKEVFEKLDKDHSGAIEQKEIHDLFSAVREGYAKAADKLLPEDMPQYREISIEQVKDLFKEADENNDKKLEYNEFVDLVDSLSELLINGANVQNLKSIITSHRADE